MRKFYLAMLLAASACHYSNAQYSITTWPYNQNFDNLGTALITSTNLNSVNTNLNGWYFSESGTGANSQMPTNAGTANTGDTYNLGASGNSNRKLGFLLSGSVVSTFGFYFTNNTGSTITALQISYTGETWRVGSANRSDRMDFQYSTDATSLTNGTWADVDGLDYTNPGQATGNGSVQHSSSISSIITGLSLANGSKMFIRFQDFNATGSDDMMGVDNFSIQLPPYYRSATSGNWNVASNWEAASSPSGPWSVATTVPDNSSSGIEIMTGHTITSTGNITVDQILVNGTLVMAPGTILTITDGGPGAADDMKVEIGGSLVFKSDATGTASLAELNGNSLWDNENITVERYIPATRRAWRLLSMPLKNKVPPTIYNSWQENGSTAAGFGTWITKPSANPGPSGDYYDAASTGTSLQYWNGASLQTPATTNIPVTDNGGAYFLFIRGDRTVTGPGSPTATTLRMTGNIYQGDVNGVGVVGTGSNPSLIPNPYPSPVDFEAIYSSYPALTTFNIWDANIGTYGAYRLVDRNGGSYQQTPSGGSPTADATARYIQSGQAFFIPAQQTIDFKEGMKVSSLPTINVFKTTHNTEELAVNLNIVNTSGNLLADGFRIKFDNNFSPNPVTGEDAIKMTNMNENLSVLVNTTDLIVDKRPVVAGTDTLQLRFWNSRMNDYSFDFTPNSLSSFSNVYLLDGYLGTITPINTATASSYSFKVDNNTSSQDPLRFKLIFTATPSQIAALDKKNAVLSLYPNPVTGSEELHIAVKGLKGNNYTVQIYNVSGQLVFSQPGVNNSGNEELRFDVSRFNTGMHQVKITSSTGETIATESFIINK